MIATLHLPIICGATTCASEVGKFCLFLRWNGSTGAAKCHVFGTPLAEVDGWVQRDPACIAASKSEEP